MVRNSRVRPTTNPDRVGGCAYTVLETVQMPGVCSNVYDTAHFKERLKLFDKTRAQSRAQKNNVKLIHLK